MATTGEWRILLVEDAEVIAKQIAEDAESGSLLPAVGKMAVTQCRHIGQAPAALETMRADFVILDIKDDTSGDEHAGLKAFEEIKAKRFVPVVFYSAVANAAVGLDNPFVRVVEKTKALPALREAFKQLYDTGLPTMLRHIEDEQRKYMWEFAHEHRAELANIPREELAVLLARRLASSLSTASVRQFLLDQELLTSEPKDNALPLEFYIYPPSDGLRAGAICYRKEADVESYYVLLSPTCQLMRGKVEQALLVGCQRAGSVPCIADLKAKGTAASGTVKHDARQLLTNRYSDRHAFLPGTFFLPDLVVDCQDVTTVKMADFGKMGYVVVAELDSPFLEALLLRFADYYGRVATPDTDVSSVLSHLGLAGNVLD